MCKRCWADAALRAQSDATKTQTEHYIDLLGERMDTPCVSEARYQ